MNLGAGCLFAVLLLAGCSREKKAPERTCEVRGEIVRVDPQVRTAVIKHEQICDWMEPMTMEFPVREQKDFEVLKPGVRITGTVHIGDPEFWLGATTVVK